VKAKTGHSTALASGRSGFDCLSVARHHNDRYHPGQWKMDLIDFLAGLDENGTFRERQRSEVRKKKLQISLRKGR
jgi:hypothetical protein